VATGQPTTWRFTLRQGVKFHDGSPFTADDVIFTGERRLATDIALRQYASGRQAPQDRRLHSRVRAGQAEPVTLEHATTIYYEQGLGGEEQGGTAAGLQGKEETFASRNANGTGPWILVSREPGIRTVLGATATGGASRKDARRAM